MQKKYSVSVHENYFKLSQRQKQDFQAELFNITVILAIKKSDQKPKEHAWTVYEAALLLKNKWLEAEQFELVQAMNDMIETYDLERYLDN